MNEEATAEALTSSGFQPFYYSPSVKCGIIQKSGAWFAYNGEKIGQGKVNAANYLKENEAVSSEIEKLIREQLMHSDKYEGDIGGYDDSENQVDADIPPMEDEPF